LGGCSLSCSLRVLVQKRSNPNVHVKKNSWICAGPSLRFGSGRPALTAFPGAWWPMRKWRYLECMPGGERALWRRIGRDLAV
jgi:hypothetical protein